MEGKTTHKKVPETENADEFDVGKKSLLDDTDVTNDKQPQENPDVPKASEVMQETTCNKDETKEPDTDETEDRTQTEGKKTSTVGALNISPKSSKANEKPHNDRCQPIDNNKQESRHSVQVSVSKTSDMNADSKVTKSETTMTSQTKQRKRAQRKVDGPIRRGNTAQGRNRLEFDQYGRPKFKPSYEMVVDVAEFRFSRCSSDSNEDSDCDRHHGCKEVVETKSKKIPKKKKSKMKKIRDTKMRDTTDPEERYVPSDSDDEPQWLNGVPPAPVRADVKSLSSLFKTRRKLKYGSHEKKIIFRKESDYFPGRLHSGASFKQTSLGSTQGMSYFNSQFMNDSAGFPSTFSDLSLPPIPPSSIPSTTEMEVKKASNEAMCGSHSKMCFVNAWTATPSEDGSVVSSTPDEGIIGGKGTMRFMNVALLHRINPTYSNERIAELYFNKTGEEHVTRGRYARDAPKRRVDKIVQKATSIYNEENAQRFLNNIKLKGQVEQDWARLPSIIRVPPTPNEYKMPVRGKPDPNRPKDAVYKTVALTERIPSEHFDTKSSPCEQHENEVLLFQQEDHVDFMPILLQALQEFVIVKETVTRPAGRGTIVSLTITKPRRYK